jgi:hypothetical protein
VRKRPEPVLTANEALALGRQGSSSLRSELRDLQSTQCMRGEHTAGRVYGWTMPRDAPVALST